MYYCNKLCFGTPQACRSRHGTDYVKVQKYVRSKQVSNFLIFGANNSGTGVLLRAELTGLTIPPFLQMGLDGRALFQISPKRTPMQDFNSFPILFYYLITSPHIKKFETYLPSSYFLTFAQCGHFQILADQLTYLNQGDRFCPPMQPFQIVRPSYGPGVLLSRVRNQGVQRAVIYCRVLLIKVS